MIDPVADFLFSFLKLLYAKHFFYPTLCFHLMYLRNCIYFDTNTANK